MREISNAVTMRGARHLERQDERVFAPEAHAREVALAARLAALAPAHDDARDVELVAQRKLERGHQQPRAPVADGRALRVHVEGAQAVAHGAPVFARSALIEGL